MNWNSIDLNSPFERSQNILDGYSSETLLLEIECNLPIINKETVKAQALKELRNKYETAISILYANLDNITDAALKARLIQ